MRERRFRRRLNMSVLKSKRGESKLEVLIKSKELYEYIQEITSNPKTFKPENITLTNKLINSALSIFILLYTANETPLSKGNLMQRRRFQTMAFAECNTLLALMDLSQNLNHFSSKRTRYVNFLINGNDEEKGLRALIRGWINSDSLRIK